MDYAISAAGLGGYGSRMSGDPTEPSWFAKWWGEICIMVVSVLLSAHVYVGRRSKKEMTAITVFEDTIVRAVRREIEPTEKQLSELEAALHAVSEDVAGIKVAIQALSDGKLSVD